MLELWVESEDIDKIIEDLSEEDLTRLEEAIWKRKQKDSLMFIVNPDVLFSRNIRLILMMIR